MEDLLSTLDAKVYLNMVNAKEDVTKASTSLTTSLAQEIADRMVMTMMSPPQPPHHPQRGVVWFDNAPRKFS